MARLTGSKSVACIMALTAGLLSTPISSQAADFSRAQHVYVPPTAFERRIESMQPMEGLFDNPEAPSPVPGYKPPSSFVPKPNSAVVTKHPYGVLPPPPAIPGVKAAKLGGSAGSTNANLSQAARQLHQEFRKAASNPTIQAAVRELKQQAVQYAQSGNLAQARHAVAEALKLSPHDKALIRELGSVSLQRAKQFMQNADLDSATKFARQALAFDSASPEANSVLNSVLQKRGENPTDPVQRLHNADLLASQGKNEEAWVEYQASEHLKPSAQAHIGMGNLALRAGEKEQALNEYVAAQHLNPKLPDVHRQLGLLKLGQGDIVGANNELSKALILDPHDTASSKALVELWQNQVSRVPGANSHLGLARAYQLSGDLSSAQAEYRTVVALDPENPHLPAARASFKAALTKQEAERAAEASHTLESQGALGPAYDKLAEAVRLNPNDADLRVHEGYLLEKLQRYADAKDAYMAALKLNPHNLLAATRLKELPTSASAPGVFIPANGGSAGGVPLRPELSTTHDAGVNNLSNFAYALRNHMLGTKAEQQAIEDQAHDMLAQVTKIPPKETLVSAPITDAAAVAASTSAATAASDPIGGSVKDTLAKAKQLLAKANGGSSNSSAEMPPLAPPLRPPITTSAPTTGVETATLDPAAPELLPPIVPQNVDVAPPLAPAPAMSNAASAGGPVRFELVSASPKTDDVVLTVSLFNDGESPLMVPRQASGVIRYTNRKDANVKVVFSSSAVLPHSFIHGTVHVPYRDADPTADLFIPDLLSGGTDRDVHLTATIPNRMQ